MKGNIRLKTQEQQQISEGSVLIRTGKRVTKTGESATPQRDQQDFWRPSRLGISRVLQYPRTNTKGGLGLDEQDHDKPGSREAMEGSMINDSEKQVAERNRNEQQILPPGR